MKEMEGGGVLGPVYKIIVTTSNFGAGCGGGTPLEKLNNYALRWVLLPVY